MDKKVYIGLGTVLGLSLVAYLYWRHRHNKPAITESSTIFDQERVAAENTIPLSTTEMIQAAPVDEQAPLKECFTAPYEQRPWIKAGGDQSKFYAFANPSNGTISQEDMCTAWFNWVKQGQA